MPPEVNNVLPPWKHFRVIHSRFPPINVFDCEDAEDQMLLAELEGATNDRLMNWQEWLPSDEFRSGSGWGAVMASFCHFSAGRFNTDNFGVYYCSDSIHTAIAEWSYHAAKLWNEHGFTDQADATVRAYRGNFTQALVDARDNEAFHQQSYLETQNYGIELRNHGSEGVLYKSVRNENGLCAGLFRPSATTAVTQAGHYTIKWDGKRFTQFARLGEFCSI